MQKFLEQLSQFKEPGFRYDDGDINFSIQFLDLKNSLDYEFQIEIGNSHTLQEILKNTLRKSVTINAASSNCPEMLINAEPVISIAKGVKIILCTSTTAKNE